MRILNKFTSDEIKAALHNPYKVGDLATICYHSDCVVHEVIAKSAKSVTLRECKATLLNGVNSGELDALQFEAGGFSGHTSGNQRYDVVSDPEGHVVVARLRKRPRHIPLPCGKWKDDKTCKLAPDFRIASGARLIQGSHQFSDYNF